MASDQLTIWQRVREQIPWADVVAHLPAPVCALRDGFATHAAAGADPRRQRSLLAAHRATRAEAMAGADLDTDLTARWNAIVRDVPAAGFRQGPAFAKSGRERYGLHPDTWQRFGACLAEAADTTVPVAARAARAYLDTVFFHPYDDGNARLGGLVLHFVLLRAGVELDDVGPILTVVRRADDAPGSADLARLVHGTALASHRRWLRGATHAFDACDPLNSRHVQRPFPGTGRATPTCEHDLST